jgi:hypothetical protein
MGNNKKMNCKLFILPVIGVVLIFSAISSYIFGKYEIKENVKKVNKMVTKLWLQN